MRGKPVLGVALASNMKEHPRVCGENIYDKEGRVPYNGTSPRMRGKRSTELPERGQTRNIPAYAGKTVRWLSGNPRQPEHPRVCGENSPAALICTIWLGTSPRMRGKRDWPDQFWCRVRNIPAYAGKTLANKPIYVLVSEHPRVCGENTWEQRSFHEPLGTSPRMRGKRHQACRMRKH